ncbi:MAG: hypothetical protein ISS15_11915 [Alphaproteobacteria bacterium]|nr:hypothetical protein [Alphaproteobacteria bacterium]MBL6936591.1 hypothetical protein [Alphaproteobacteria bacterium]MBL7098358.1 hypothetical protein [Alphaproteobacteria bacterium]
MKMILAAGAATLIAFAAYAAEPVAPPANNPSVSPPVTNPAQATSTPAATDTAPGAVTMPASAAPSESCAAMITRARGMTMPSDTAKAATARSEITAADAAGDDAMCRRHAQAALNALGGM